MNLEEHYLLFLQTMVITIIMIIGGLGHILWMQISVA
jgi:hypothetical protein